MVRNLNHTSLREMDLSRLDVSLRNRIFGLRVRSKACSRKIFSGKSCIAVSCLTLPYDGDAEHYVASLIAIRSPTDLWRTRIFADIATNTILERNSCRPGPVLDWASRSGCGKNFFFRPADRNASVFRGHLETTHLKKDYTPQTIGPVLGSVPRASVKLRRGKAIRHWNLWRTNIKCFLCTTANGQAQDIFILGFQK